MRWAIFAGVALFALVVIAAAVGRAIRVVHFFAPVPADESESVASAASCAGDSVTRSPAEPSEVANRAAVEVSADLDEALRNTRATGVPSKRGEAGPADPGAQVEAIAQKVAPTLAREAVEHSADTAERNPEVEHELLETWKEQKQILAGQRTTIDSVLKDTPQ
jgi:hypothetical protein